MALDPTLYDPYREGGGGGYWPGTEPGGAPPILPVTPPPVVTGGGGGGGGANGGGGGLNYNGLSVRPTFNFGPAPVFRPSVFRAPTFAEAQNEPGYQFRLEGGRDALEGSAAARGTLRTGGTLKDITEYGQNFAAQEYGNVYNRALQSFDRQYRGEYDAFQPRMAEWTLLSQAERDAAMAQFAREWQVYAANRTGGGGGRGPSYEQDIANMPPLPGPPPGWLKPNNPDLLEWRRRRDEAMQPAATGELWPEAF